MFKKILVPTDGTPLADKVVAAAIEFAKINKNSKIVGVSVIVPVLFSPFESLGRVDTEEHEQMLYAQASEYLEKLKDMVDAAGIPCETHITKSSSPAGDIVQVSVEQECDCIFMSSHGRKGLNKFFLGSETQKVLSQASVPVMVYR